MANVSSSSKEEVSGTATVSQSTEESYSTGAVDTTDVTGELPAADKSVALPTTTDESAGEEYLNERSSQSNRQSKYLFIYCNAQYESRENYNKGNYCFVHGPN